MYKKLRVLAGITAVCAVMACAVSCEDKDKTPEANEIPETTLSVKEDKAVGADIKGQTIVWLSDYDLNPAKGSPRSSALSMFEEHFGAKVAFIYAQPQDLYTALSEKVNGGEQVDMFPYDETLYAKGVMAGYYQPLDPYFASLGYEEEGLWDDMKETAERISFNGQHYVMPYSVSEPVVLTYSRKLVKDEGLDDPYTLYQSGNWNWDTFMGLMDKFVENSPEDSRRMGIVGEFGRAVIESTGHSVITNENGGLANNISDPEIEKAELLLQDIAAKNYFRAGWPEAYPNNNETLFFASRDWTLAGSNSGSPEGDLMIVPVPTPSGADKNYLTCNLNAKMLLRNSDKGDAVAAYIKCERMAAVNETYKDAEKKAVTAGKSLTNGAFVTEEQYDALMNILDTSVSAPVLDLGWGLSAKMNGYADPLTDDDGAMDMLSEDVLYGAKWDELREKCNGIIDEEMMQY